MAPWGSTRSGSQPHGRGPKSGAKTVPRFTAGGWAAVIFPSIPLGNSAANDIGATPLYLSCVNGNAEVGRRLQHALCDGVHHPRLQQHRVDDRVAEERAERQPHRQRVHDDVQQHAADAEQDRREKNEL